MPLGRICVIHFHLDGPANCICQTPGQSVKHSYLHDLNLNILIQVTKDPSCLGEEFILR